MRRVLVGIFVAGCGGGALDTAGDSSAEACTATPAVEVGTGDYAFEPLADGDTVTMVHGPQGGWHVLGSVRIDGFDPIVSIQYTIALADDGTVVSDQNYRVQAIAEGACGGYYPGMYGYLDVSALAAGEADTPPELLAGRSLVLGMALTDTLGNAASGTRTVVAGLDPVDADGGDTDATAN